MQATTAILLDGGIRVKEGLLPLPEGKLKQFVDPAASDRATSAYSNVYHRGGWYGKPSS